MNIKKLGYISFLLLLSIVFIGCSKDTNTPNKDVEDKVDEPADDVVEGGVLNFAINAQPPNLDPHSNTNLETRDISHHIYEPLLTLNDSLEVEPMLAESYEVSEGGKAITFHLREGIKFHNGKEMTAADVIASMERWHEMSAQAITYLSGTKYEAKDDYTVIAHIAKPTTLDLYVLADLTQFAAIMPKEIVENAGVEWVEEYIGTGPYKFNEWKQDQNIHLTKYEEFQSRSEPASGLSGEKKGIVDDVYFHIVKDASTRVTGLQSGEYDIAKNIQQDSAEILENDSNIKNMIHTSGFPVILFNQKHGVFTNQLARQAVNAAVNVEDILVAAYGSEKYYEKNHALVKEEQKSWYTEAGSEAYNLFDLELAKRLLDESGYDGEEIVILTTRDRMDWYNMMVVVQQQLEHLGMNVKLEVSDSATLADRLDDENNWDLYSTSFAFRPMPIQYHFLNPEWYGWINSEELAALSDKILYAGTQQEAQQYSEEFHQVLWEYLPIIKPGNQTNITSMRKGVEGFQYIAGPIIWNVSIND